MGGLGFLSAALDPDRNSAPSGDRDVSAEGSAVAVVVVAAREDLEIAAQVRDLLGDDKRPVTEA